MSVKKSTSQLVDNIAKKRKERESQRFKRRVHDAILKITSELRITETELSLALGVRAPEPGGGGSSLVSQWKRGAKKPGKEMLAALEMLAQGELRLRQIGKEGRRTIYQVEHATCPSCGWVLKRRGVWDYCDKCLTKHEPDPDVLAVDQGGHEGEPDLKEMLQWVASREATIDVTTEKDVTQVVICRDPHKLTLWFERLKKWVMKSGDRVWGSR